MILTVSGHSDKERHSKDGNGMSKILRAREYVPYLRNCTESGFPGCGDA